MGCGVPLAPSALSAAMLADVQANIEIKPSAWASATSLEAKSSQSKAGSEGSSRGVFRSLFAHACDGAHPAKGRGLSVPSHLRPSSSRNTAQPAGMPVRP